MRTRTKRQSGSGGGAFRDHFRDALDKSVRRVEEVGSAVKALERRLVPAGWLLTCMPEPELIQMRDKYEYLGVRRSPRSTLPRPLRSWHAIQICLLRSASLYSPGSILASRGMLNDGTEGDS